MSDDQASSVPFRSALVGSVLMLAAAAGLAGWAHGKIGPDARVPIHWNAAGEVDGYAGPVGLWLMVGVLAFLILVLALVPLIEPRRGHLLRSSRAYQATWLATVGFLAMVHVAIVLSALGYEIPINRWILSGLGCLFAVIGNYLGKTRSNFIYGIRTPWTLSSEQAWRRTHRLGGRLFVAAGVVLILAAVANPAGGLLLGLLIPTLVIVALAPIIASYFHWRSASDRTDSRTTAGSMAASGKKDS